MQEVYYTPAHRSLLEFFVAYKFAAELGVLAPDFTELAKAQSHLDKSASSDYTWSSYFRHQCDKNGDVRPIPSLQEFIPEEIGKLAKTVGKEPLTTDFFNKRKRSGHLLTGRHTTAVSELMWNMISDDKEKVKARLLLLIRETCGKATEEVGVIGGNIATVLVQYDCMALRGQNLADANLSHANFYKTNLTECNLERTDLSNAKFDKSSTMVRATLRDSNLRDASIREIVWGWISKIPLNKTRSFSREYDTNEPAIFFYYPGTDDYSDRPNLPFEVKENEIVVAYRKNRVLKWVHKIQSVYIINWNVNRDVVQILTIEGENVNVDLNSGQCLPGENKNSLRQWALADLAGARGLDERDAYILGILGAINVPNTSYKPRNDIGINKAIQHKAAKAAVNKIMS